MHASRLPQKEGSNYCSAIDTCRANCSDTDRHDFVKSLWARLSPHQSHQRLCLGLIVIIIVPRYFCTTEHAAPRNTHPLVARLKTPKLHAPGYPIVVGAHDNDFEAFVYVGCSSFLSLQTCMFAVHVHRRIIGERRAWKMGCEICCPYQYAQSLTYLLDVVPFGYGAEPLPASDGASWAEAIGSPSLAPWFRLA